MKKILLILGACLSIATNAWANSNITIDKAGVGEVLDFTADFYAALNPGFVVMHKDAQSVVLAGKLKTAEGSIYVKQVRFAAEVMDSDLQLSMDSVNVKRDAAGKATLEANYEPGSEHFLLCLIKGAFNEHYNFGYILSTNYRHGGFVVDAAEPDTAIFKAGMRQGDILTHVNGIAIQPKDEGRYNDKALTSCFTGEETEFTVLRGTETVKFKCKPDFEAALLKH